MDEGAVAVDEYGFVLAKVIGPLIMGSLWLIKPGKKYKLYEVRYSSWPGVNEGPHNSN